MDSFLILPQLDDVRHENAVGSLGIDGSLLKVFAIPSKRTSTQSSISVAYSPVRHERSDFDAKQSLEPPQHC